MNCPYNVKICTKCNKLLIACNLNFSKKKSGKYGFRADCRECERKRRREYEKRKSVKEKRKEYYKVYSKREDVKERRKEYNKREDVKKRRKEHNKKYIEEHREKRLEYWKKYNENRKEELKEYYKEYWGNNQDKLFNYNNKRREIESNQGGGLSDEQWLEMMNFFEWRCAYSGEYIGGKENKKRSIDHIIPLSQNGKHEVWNCVPMYRPYNSSKRANDMKKWYKKQDFYSEERLNKIYEWCEYAWNKWYKKRRKGNKKFFKN